MSRSLKRAKAPFLAGLALVAVALAIPVAANAAMGGAVPITTTLRPDLRTAKITGVDPVAVETTVEFCFNKVIDTLPQAGSLAVGNYRQTEVTADSAERTSPQCATATFSSTDIDATQDTYATAEGSDGTTFGGFTPPAVTNAANGLGNIRDSTPLIGSNTNNGTTGKTTGPDLVGITANNSTNTINYIFDQNVSRSTPAGPGLYFFNDAAGDTFSNAGAAPSGITVAQNVVAVSFGAGTNVANAVRAYVGQNAVLARNGGLNGGILSVARPGRSGLTDDPDLLSTTLSASGTTVDFVYDETIVAPIGGLVPGAFKVTRSDGAIITTTAAPVIVNGNTVRATIPSGSDQNEYFVTASADDDAVASVVTGNLSTAGGLPIGGNAGAFATGFTTGPEALSVTFDNVTGVARIRLDQRFSTSQVSQVTLLSESGSQVAAAAISISGAGGSAGQQIATVTFTPAQLRGARSVLLEPNALTTFVGYPNVVQALSPTATTAALSKTGSKKVRFRAARGLVRKARG